ncbi:MAG: hypothetical protein LLF94_08920 [Chlamydiales bacterium]|nr:hypothetical protein [Chlamydiales bacterium]
MTALASAHIVDSALSAVATGVGFLAWHGGERAVRAITGSKYSVLSNNSNYRQIVYESKGITLLALGASFVRYPPVALFALPIILGSLYGTINNQFTVRNCPEYYTMGHYYDGEKLDGHAIKTNNLIIKPITTGCYATTMVTKFAGTLLSAAGTLRYTRGAPLPVSWAAAMIGGVSLVSLVAGHILATRKTASIEANLQAYADLMEFTWTDEQKDKTFAQICNEVEGFFCKKLMTVADHEIQVAFLTKVYDLKKSILNEILHPNLPVKYIAGWASNNTRNSTGYLVAGVGTLAVTIATVALRTFAL